MIYWLTIALIMAVIIAFCSIGALLVSIKNNDDLRAQNDMLVNLNKANSKRNEQLLNKLNEVV